MRRSAHEGEEIVRRMELALPCGLRPDCNAVTVAVESPEEKRGLKKTTLQEQAHAAERRIRELASSNATVSAAARGPLSAIAAALPVALAVTREPSFSSNVTSSGSSTAAAIVVVALAT